MKSVHDENTSINYNECKMNQKTLLSSFLPLVLEEYEERRKPGVVHSPRNAQKTVVQQQSSFSRYAEPTHSLCDDCIRGNDQESHHKAIPGNVSLVSDNAKMPTTRLRERSGSLQFSDNGKDDRRQNSSSTFDFDHSSSSILDHNRDSAASDDDAEEFFFAPLSASSGRRDSFLRFSQNLAADNRIDKPLDHRWSAHSSFSSIQGLPMSVDHVPKKCARRPSL